MSKKIEGYLLNEEELDRLADDIYFTGSPEDFRDIGEFMKLYDRDQELKKNFLMCCSWLEKSGYGIVKKEKAAS